MIDIYENGDLIASHENTGVTARQFDHCKFPVSDDHIATIRNVDCTWSETREALWNVAFCRGFQMAEKQKIEKKQGKDEQFQKDLNKVYLSNVFAHMNKELEEICDGIHDIQYKRRKLAEALIAVGKEIEEYGK